MHLKQIDREPYYRIDIKTDTHDADYAYRTVDVREDEYGDDFPLFLKNLTLMYNTIGVHFGLEKLFESDVLEPDLLFDIMPYDRHCAENRYSSAGHTLESLRIRYYSDKEYEVILS